MLKRRMQKLLIQQLLMPTFVILKWRLPKCFMQKLLSLKLDMKQLPMDKPLMVMEAWLAGCQEARSGYYCASEAIV